MLIKGLRNVSGGVRAGQVTEVDDDRAKRLIAAGHAVSAEKLSDREPRLFEEDRPRPAKKATKKATKRTTKKAAAKKAPAKKAAAPKADEAPPEPTPVDPPKAETVEVTEAGGNDGDGA